MKTTILLILLTISFSSFSQTEEKQLIGVWRYENTTNIDDKIIEYSAVKQFDFHISEDHSFIMSGKEYSITGTWKIEDEHIVLDGTQSNTSNKEVAKMKIRKVSDSLFSFEIYDDLIVNVKRIE